MGVIIRVLAKIEKYFFFISGFKRRRKILRYIKQQLNREHIQLKHSSQNYYEIQRTDEYVTRNV